MIKYIKTNMYTIIVGVGLFTGIGCNLYYDFSYDPILHADECYPCDVFFFGRYVAWVCCTFVLYRLIPSMVTSFFLAVTIQQLIDEILNDPTKNPLIEYIGFLILFVILYYNARKKDKRPNKNIKGKSYDIQ